MEQKKLQKLMKYTESRKKITEAKGVIDARGEQIDHDLNDSKTDKSLDGTINQIVVQLDTTGAEIAADSGKPQLKNANKKRYPFERLEILDFFGLEVNPLNVEKSHNTISDEENSFAKFYQFDENHARWESEGRNVARENLTNSYFDEYVSNNAFKNFIVKLEIFMSIMLQSNYIKFFNLRFDFSRSHEKYVAVQDTTLLGRRYLELFNDFNLNGYFNEFAAHGMSHAYRIFASDVFTLIGDGIKYPYLNRVAATVGELDRTIATVGICHELNLKAIEIRQLIKEFKKQNQKHDSFIDILNPNQLNKLFDKSRVVIRLKLQNPKLMHSDINIINVLFSNFMKRIKGAGRVSPDIEYLRLIRQKRTAIVTFYIIDVLCFIEPLDKFHSNCELIKELRDHWSKTVSHFFEQQGQVVVKSVSGILGEFQVRLMKSDFLLNQDSFFVEPLDHSKINAITHRLIPSFIGQAVYAPIANLPKNMRQIQGSRAFSRVNIEKAITVRNDKTARKKISKKI